MKNSCSSIQLKIGGDREVHNFPKGVSQKVNLNTLLECELTYYVNHYTTGNSPNSCLTINFKGLQFTLEHNVLIEMKTKVGLLSVKSTPFCP